MYFCWNFHNYIRTNVFFVLKTKKRQQKQRLEQEFIKLSFVI